MNPNARILDRTLKRTASESSGPVRVQFWLGKQFLFAYPIRIVDGVADDIKFCAKKTFAFDKLVFVHGGKVFPHRTGYRNVLSGTEVFIALSHLQLRDKFGHNVLG